MSSTQTSGAVITELVETMRKLAGPHPGFRPVHAKGIVCTGTFRGSPEARSVCRAPHFEGQPVSAAIRFANSSGSPQIHDGLPGLRSMAVKFQIPQSKGADILANSIEGFPARTPEDFLAFLRAQLPDAATGQPRPDALANFVENHPAARAFIGRLTQKAIPASYGQTEYHAEHAFRFIASDGTARFGRYHWTPEAGEAYLSPNDGVGRSANFLRDELENRLKNGPVRFRLFLQLAEEGDPSDDVTALWPGSRQRVELGRLEITAISPTNAADERRLIFDPTNVADGIELSSDPILLARSAAYSISYEQRNKAS